MYSLSIQRYFQIQNAKYQNVSHLSRANFYHRIPLIRVKNRFGCETGRTNGTKERQKGVTVATL